METITAKQLHQETKSVLDQLEGGESLVITRNGEPIARLEPLLKGRSPGWDEIMREVWQAQAQIKGPDRVANPVLAATSAMRAYAEASVLARVRAACEWVFRAWPIC
jgi:antitoxin (DNA-binding transcriptional repressor) of toxin-antitoxin stability system